jgi:hypothetical protein
MEQIVTTPPDDEEDRWLDGSLEAGADDAPPPDDSALPAGDIPADADADVDVE